MNSKKVTLHVYIGLIISSLMLASCKPNENSLATLPAADSTQSQLKEDSANTIESTIIELTNQIAATPKDAELFYQRSQKYYELGNTLLAREDAQQCLELQPNSGKCYYLLGFYDKIQNKEKEALQHFLKAEELGVENAENYYEIGKIYFEQKNYLQAEKYYRESIKRDSLAPIYPFALGFMYQLQNKTDKAIEHYLKSLRLNPQFVKALAQLFTIYRVEKKDWATALRFNRQILAIDSLHPLARYNEADYYFERAMSLQEADSLTAKVEYQFFLQRAIDQLSMALSEDPQFSRAYYLRGYCSYLLGAQQKALQDMNNVVELDPLHHKAFYMRGAIHEYFGNLKAALLDYKRAHEIAPNFIYAKEDFLRLKEKLDNE